MKFVFIGAPRPRRACEVFWLEHKRPAPSPQPSLAEWQAQFTLAGVDFFDFFRGLS